MGCLEMFPDLINIGFLHLRTYGACMAVGFLLCWTLIERLSGRKDLSNCILSMMVAGVVGARAAYVIEHWSSEFAARPQAWPRGITAAKRSASARGRSFLMKHHAKNTTNASMSPP